MRYGKRALKNMHIYVGLFLYNVKYEQLDHANFSLAFGMLITNNESAI
jgi:hypothetical protein